MWGTTNMVYVGYWAPIALFIFSCGMILGAGMCAGWMILRGSLRMLTRWWTNMCEPTDWQTYQCR